MKFIRLLYHVYIYMQPLFLLCRVNIGGFFMSKLKRAIIKEELLTLTGDFKKAVILNQMIYWSERVADFDRFIEEEKKRASYAMGTDERQQAELTERLPLSQGWIYKSAEELSEETMLGLSRSNMGTHL